VLKANAAARCPHANMLSCLDSGEVKMASEDQGCTWRDCAFVCLCTVRTGGK